MHGLAQRNDQSTKGSSATYSLSTTNGFWSKHRDDVSYNQLQKFWSELSLQARQELLRIDKQTLFEQARKNMYCSRCNGLLLEGFLQIVMYGKSLQQEGTCGNLPCNRLGVLKYQADSGSNIVNGCQDEIQDPSVHPWGGLTTARDGSLTLMDCYIYSKSLLGLQNVFDSARARERERELLYPDACGGGGRGWISQGIVSYGRGHGTRETCALHTARLSCDTLVDFWSALGEETRQSLLRMKEEDFIERLLYRFDSKRFCRDCRRNVNREFKELKELKRMRREPRCTSWFCAADTAFQYEVSDDTIQVDWHQTFADSVGTYHYFEWAVGTAEGKADILEFENVGMNGSVKVSGLDLGGLGSCFITLRACKLDGRCTELSVKAHALKGQQCVHSRLIVGDGFVTITRGESIRQFFEHAEEAEEEEEDDSMDKDGNELDGECSRPQKHAKSPELAREFLLDAATVIFKEQVEKAFREGTARQNAHSIFVCLALKLLEERVHVACKEIITLEKQMKLLEEEEKEKREEEERKERRRTKEREKKLRRKERLKGMEKDRDKKCEATQAYAFPVVSKEDSSPIADEEPNNCINSRDSVSDSGDAVSCMPGSTQISDELFSEGGYNNSTTQNCCYDSPDAENINIKDGSGSFIVERSKFSRKRLEFRKEVQLDQSIKWFDTRRFAVNKSDSRFYGDNFETPSRSINVSNRQLRTNASRSSGRHNLKFNEKLHCSHYRISDRYDVHSCSCNQNSEYRAKMEPYGCSIRVGRDAKHASKSESAFDMCKQFYRGNKYNKVDYIRETCGRSKNKAILGNNNISGKKVWEPMESHKKYPRSNSDSDVTLRASTFKEEKMKPDSNNHIKSPGDVYGSEFGENFAEIDQEENNLKEQLKEAAYKDHKNLNSSISPSNGTFDPVQSSPSNSDNCSSSCVSEGDINSASSNHENLESSSTSDSEDASLRSERRETSVCIQSSFSEHHEVGAKKATEGDTVINKIFSDPSQDGVGSNIFENGPKKVVQNSDSGLSAVNLHSQNQGMLPLMHNQNNIHYHMLQASPTVGYYHQNPVPWTPTPTNRLVSFPHPSHCLYASPLGYGVDGNSPFCMPYGPLQPLATPLFNPNPVPIYQPVAKESGINVEERVQISKPGTISEGPNESNLKTPVSDVLCSTNSTPTGECKQHDDSAKLQIDSNGFSLFQCGPFALCKGNKSNPMPSQEGIVGNFSKKYPADHSEGYRASNKKETIIGEYNLFEASKGITFSFF